MRIQSEDRYDPRLLPQLQEFAAGDEYSLEASLCLLRLYHFRPSEAQPDLVSKILLKALKELPRPDYKVCSHLLSSSLQSSPPVAAVLRLGDLLESTAMDEFWQACADCSDIISKYPSFLDAAHTYAASVAAGTSKRLARATLERLVNLKGDKMDALIQSQVKNNGWRVEGDLITMPDSLGAQSAPCDGQSDTMRAAAALLFSAA